jgi:hypothetical protein
MSDQIKVNSPPIAPVYSQAEPNQPINLGSVAVQFDHKGTTYQETANVVMRFLPADRLEFVFPLEGKPPMFGWSFIVDGDRNVEIKLIDRGVSFEAFCVAVGGDHGGIVFRPTKSGVRVTLPSEAISTATFHLFNFPDFNGPEDYILVTGELPLQSAKVCGRVVIKAEGWSIIIAATDQTDSLTKKLDRQGGYVLTHMGQIAREDGTTFSSERLDDLLNCLHYFLSFALGRWTGVALPIGFDAEGDRVFEEWGMRKIADGRWDGSTSWFDMRHGDLLSQVFPGFLSLWTNKIWRQPLTHALYWYLGACDRGVGIGVDTGLILAQTALETLAWTHCILERKMVSATAFKPRGLSAADKLRLLVSALDIPQQIPSELSALHARKGKKWIDGLDAITCIRNSLVHSDVNEKFPENSYYEAWLLSLWYIDLVLLRLCGHSGKYANRLSQGRWVGQVESVPLAQNEATGKRDDS